MRSCDARRRKVVTRCAIARLGSVRAAMFLCQPHSALGEQKPLIIAESSEIGLRAVLGLLAISIID